MFSPRFAGSSEFVRGAPSKRQQPRFGLRAWVIATDASKHSSNIFTITFLSSEIHFASGA